MAAAKRIRRPPSFRARLAALTLLFLAVFILVITLILTYTYGQALLTQAKDQTLGSFSVAEKEIGTLLQDARTSMLVLQNDQDVQRCLLHRYANNLQMVSARLALINAVKNGFYQQRAFSGFLFIGSDDSFLACLNKRSVFAQSAVHPFVAKYGAEIRRWADGSIHWLGPYSVYDITQLALDKTDTLDNRVMLGVVASPYRTAGKGQPMAIVAVRANVLLSAFEYIHDGDSSLCLLNADGALIASVNGAQAPAPDVLAAIRGAGDGAVTVGKNYVISQTLPGTSWMLVKSIPRALYLKSVSALRNRALTYAAVILCAAILIYLASVRIFMRPLGTIGNALERMRAGDLSCRIRTRMNTQEMELIRCQFNDMAENIQQLILTKQHMEHEKMMLEMRNLQTQLSPHMIFNSITAIRWMATLRGANGVSDMLIALAELLRPYFRDWRMDWTLGEEVQYMEHYAKLLRLRYGTCFSLERDIPETLYPYKIPRFIFQPLLENCCEHGGMNTGSLLVSVRVWREGGDMLAQVRDNGAGIEPEQLRQLRLSLDEECARSHVGLYNVHKRIRLLCGEKYGLRIDSAPGEGTTISLRMRCMADGKACP